MFDSIPNQQKKNLAIDLRRQGKTYTEILTKIGVAKSTLSLWLRDVNLTKRQTQRVTEKRLQAARKGGEAKRNQRLASIQQIDQSAKKEINAISDRELWLMGTMLYWAEGSKEKEGRPGSGVQFTNSDAKMIALFIKWLRDIALIPKNDIYFDLFIHENHKHRVNEVIMHWAGITGWPVATFQHVYFKKPNMLTKRKNIGENYYGVLKVRVRKSSVLNRKIAGWVKAVIDYVV